VKSLFIIGLIYVLLFSSLLAENNNLVTNRLNNVIELIQKDSLTAKTLCNGKFNNIVFVIDSCSTVFNFSNYYLNYFFIKLLADTNLTDTNIINTKPKRIIWTRKFDENRIQNYVPVCINFKK
jgi:hypothetical protein